MRDRSYQWLKDATSFGLISNKSAKNLTSKIQKITNFPYEIGHFRSLWAWLTLLLGTEVMSLRMCKGYFLNFEHGQAPSMENFQFFEYLDLNYSALLAE